MILYNKDSAKYFATTGGYGHITIQEISTNDFGLEILSRIINADDKALKATKERSLTGSIQGEIKFFRNDYNIYENENFGNVYNEINAIIDKKQLKEVFDFSKNDIKSIKSNSLCVAKNSFSLKKSISFDELLSIINKCENLLNKPSLVEINSFEKIAKTNKYLKDKLYTHLLSDLYRNYQDEKEILRVEISHKEFDKYYYSNKVIINSMINKDKQEFSFEYSIREIHSILKKIKTINSELSVEDFIATMKNSHLTSFDENGDILTEDSLINHFCAEITMGSQNFFLIEKDWYRIKDSFINKINEQASHFSKDYKYTKPILKKWDNHFSSENEYNASYIGDSNSLVFDRFTPQNIEACDFLKWDENNIYFYHVKKGFNNSMRDLCNQVFIAARRILEDSKTGYNFLGLLYDYVAECEGNTDYSLKAKQQFDDFTKEQFLSLFEQRNIIFVLAFVDTAVTNRDITQNIDLFYSNIAKFSLIELAKKMRNIDVKFQIAQLKK